jgi:hypothetical protein
LVLSLWLDVILTQDFLAVNLNFQLASSVFLSFMLVCFPKKKEERNIVSVRLLLEKYVIFMLETLFAFEFNVILDMSSIQLYLLNT